MTTQEITKILLSINFTLRSREENRGWKMHYFIHFIFTDKIWLRLRRSKNESCLK